MMDYVIYKILILRGEAQKSLKKISYTLN